jgi:hypothetical protein
MRTQCTHNRTAAGEFVDCVYLVYASEKPAWMQEEERAGNPC